MGMLHLTIRNVGNATFDSRDHWNAVFSSGAYKAILILGKGLANEGYSDKNGECFNGQMFTLGRVLAV